MTCQAIEAGVGMIVAGAIAFRADNRRAAEGGQSPFTLAGGAGVCFDGTCCSTMGAWDVIEG